MLLETFLFFLPHLATAGFFSDHVQRNLNHEIDPCDDFYEHVCSTTMVNGPRFQDESTKSFNNTLEQLVSPIIREFRMKMKEDIESFPDVEMNQEDAKALEEYFTEFGNECRLPRLNLVNQFLFAIEAYDALYRLQSSPHYKTLEKKIERIFVVVKAILNEEFLLDHNEFDNLQLEKEVVTIKGKYDNCLSTSTNKTKQLSIKCINYAVCDLLLQPTPFNGRILSFFVVVGTRALTALSFNAFYSPEKNTVSLNPPLYTLEEDDLPFMLGSLDVVLSHEMGHIFFHGKVVPSNSECLRKHLQNTCYSYISNKTECELYDLNSDCLPVENGNYSRFDDDAADWIGMYAGLKSLRRYYPKVFIENKQTDSQITSTELIKKFFYAHAINWCSEKPTEGDKDHSPNKVRVNGIVSMFDEFAEVFQCKRGSKMAKAATCLPFAGIGAPTSKRNGVQ